MRPKSIRLFELFYLAAIAMVTASAIYDFSAILASTEQSMARRGIDPFTLAISGIVLAIGFKLVLWFMLARLRIGFVRYIVILVILWEAWNIPLAMTNGVSPSDIVAIADVVLQVIAIVFTFTASARAWFAAPVVEDRRDP